MWLPPPPTCCRRKKLPLQVFDLALTDIEGFEKAMVGISASGVRLRSDGVVDPTSSFADVHLA